MEEVIMVAAGMVDMAAVVALVVVKAGVLLAALGGLVAGVRAVVRLWPVGRDRL
jgi:hypothetical protein